MENIVLEAINVHKRYRLGKLEVDALRGINLAIESREFFALAGSSGSGKTTLLNLFGCIDLPSSGSILVQKKDPSTLSPNDRAHLRARSIGFIFQTFNLLPVLSALENVEYPLLLLGHSSSERKELGLKALERVGLSKRAHNRPDQLSGGERQRVAIARALIKNPAIILADEPTANLDRKNAEGVLDLMRDLNEKDGLTFVFSSHDPLVLSRAKRVFHMQDGIGIPPS